MHSATLKQELSVAEYPLALTGAGISVASGLPTFNISWEGIPGSKILTREFFSVNPKTFYDFYRHILQWKKAQPNVAHKVLAKYAVSIITQNIDGLHQKAGSKKVLELHGNLRSLICENCKRQYVSLKALEEEIPCCECGYILKPDIILLGDAIHDWQQAQQECINCDLMLIIGTSLQIAPVNLLPKIAQKNNAKVLFINRNAESLFQGLL